MPGDNARLCSTIARRNFSNRIYMCLHRIAQRFQMVHGEFIFCTLRANVGVYQHIASARQVGMFLRLKNLTELFSLAFRNNGACDC